jgi:hypothetical protein
MIKKYFLLFLIIILTNNVFAQPQQDSAIYIPYRKGDKWGLCDINKKIIVAPKYDYVQPGLYNANSIILVNQGGKFENFREYDFFHMGCSGGKYGCINTRGEEIIPIEYDALEKMSISIDGIYGKSSKDISVNEIAAKKNGKWGLLSRTGKVIVPFVFSNDNANGYIKLDDQQIIYNKNKYPFKEAKPIYSTKTGKEIDVQLKLNETYVYDKGVIYWRDTILGETTAYGIIDTGHTKAIRLTFNRIEEFINGFAVVDNFSENRRQQGLIDQTGKEVIPVKYDGVHFHSSSNFNCDFKKYGIVVVENEGKYGLVNLKGDIIAPMQYDKIDYGCRGGIFEMIINGRRGLLNTKGKEIIPAEYKIINPAQRSVYLQTEEEGYVFLEFNGKVGAFNTNGEEVIPFIYDEFYKNNYNEYKFFPHNNFIWAKRNGKWAMVSSKGKEILPPAYDTIKNIGNFGANEFEMIINNKVVGYVNNNGDISKVPTNYDWVSTYEKNVVRLAMKNNQYLLLNEQNKEIAVLNYDEAYIVDGHIIVQKAGKFGIVNFQGKEVLAPTYDQIGGQQGYMNYDQSGIFEVTNLARMGNKWAFIDSTGKPLTDFIYTGIYYCSDNSDGDSKIKYMVTIADKNGYRHGYTDEYGKLLIPVIYPGLSESMVYRSSTWRIEDGFINVKTRKGDGLYDQDGKLTLNPEYKEIITHENGIISLITQDNKYGYVNKSGMKYFEE